jgi:hypothetical protein
VVRDVTLAAQERALAPFIGTDRVIAAEGTFRYQACDDRECYLPRTVPLKWIFTVLRLDSQRAPADLQRK